jgi:hypothetical protein
MAINSDWDRVVAGRLASDSEDRTKELPASPARRAGYERGFDPSF